MVRSMLNSSSLPSSEHRDARFERLGVDDDFLVDLLFRADEPLDFFHEVRGGGFDGIHQCPSGCSVMATGSKFFLLHLRGSFRAAARGNPFCPGVRGWSAAVPASLAGGRPAAMFSARSISCVWRFSNRRSSPPCSAHDFGARLRGVAVGFLRGLAQAALGAEPHSAASPRKIVVAHNVSILFDGCGRFASGPARSTSTALKTRRNLTAAVGCPSPGRCECSCRY